MKNVKLETVLKGVSAVALMLALSSAVQAADAKDAAAPVAEAAVPAPTDAPAPTADAVPAADAAPAPEMAAADAPAEEKASECGKGKKGKKGKKAKGKKGKKHHHKAKSGEGHGTGSEPSDPAKEAEVLFDPAADQSGTKNDSGVTAPDKVEELDVDAPAGK